LLDPDVLGDGDAATNDHDDGGARSYSGATGLWQAVLWADGAIERDGTRLDESDIDCEFGLNTEAATRSWQSSTGGLTVDGRAGPRTWGKADSNLILKEYVDGAWVVEYIGRYNGRRFQVVRNDIGRGYYYDGWYWSLSWGPDFIQYHRKADGCGSGAPRYP
jgi:hypothetical protein